jgi:hypothetical protein
MLYSPIALFVFEAKPQEILKVLLLIHSYSSVVNKTFTDRPRHLHGHRIADPFRRNSRLPWPLIVIRKSLKPCQFTDTTFVRQDSAALFDDDCSGGSEVIAIVFAH